MNRLFILLARAGATLALLAAVASPALAQAPRLTLRADDHVVLIGSAVADRMQHSGHFEALVHAAFPDLRLVFRNLAVAGDEVAVRHRSENFGSPDDWLIRTRADVILAFFGANESAAGPEGLPKFRADLAKFLQETRQKNYSDKGFPRVVLFSPIAQERHPDPNYADPTAANARLQAYTAAMAEVARANGVPFVDLFAATTRLYAQAAGRGQPLTWNGFFLTDAGDRALAPVIFQDLFGQPAPAFNIEKLRLAVNEKNAQWHQRYRTIDGYNVYGGRSALAYQEGKGAFISDRNAPAPYLSNYKVLQEEMSVRDALTANRDRRVWGVAQGQDPEIDDSNLPRVTPVPTNKKGPSPEGAHTFLGGEEAIARMTVHSHMKINLFASEEQFPALSNPVQMAWDTRGRLWVAAWPNYPERSPDSRQGDSLLVFEDTDGDGRADKCTPFVDDLNGPTGFQFYQDGVLLVQAPDLWFLRDTDGDGRADWKERILMGLDSADSHHTSNAVALDPGGSIYLSDGVFHRTQVETAGGPVRNDDAAIFRFEPRTGKFETYIAYGFANPHGKVFDRWGNDFVTDATGNNTYFAPAFSGYLDYPAKHPGLREFWNRPSRPCPGTGMISSRHFPEEFQANFLNLNVISFQGIYRVKVTEDGSGLKGETLENIVSSTDPNFRPICVSTGPDGALYFCDWHNPIIGHMQHHLRDPSRDKSHGRVYRITYPGRPLLRQPKIDGQPIPALLDLLKEPEDGVRELAKVELGERNPAEVIAATRKWAAALDPAQAAQAHHLMEALWVHQWMNVVDVELLGKLLASPEPRARAAATRVLCYWRDRVPGALDLLKGLAADSHPRVRLEAVRAASFFRDAAAAEVALAAVNHPLDYYLEYTLKETMRQLQKYWRPALAAGRPLAAGNPAGAEYLVKSVTTPELLKLPRSPGILSAILRRPDASDLDRTAALSDLAASRQVARAAALLDLVEEAGRSNDESAPALARLLASQAPAELKTSRTRLAALARDGQSPAIRSAAWASLAVADDDFAAVWSEAGRSPAALTELLNGVPLILDAALRARLNDRLRPLLGDLPADLQARLQARPAGTGRYVRVELPRNGTLTLAEVEVFSGERNVGRQGRASQSSTSNGGDASRALDGNTDGSFGNNGQTHTAENQANPWWEVDLGQEFPIDAVQVWNRTEGQLGKRLDGFKLSVLDAGRRPVFEKAGQPAPDVKVRLAVGGDPAGALRRAAIRALVSASQDTPATFAALGALVRRGEQVAAAASGLRALPRPDWPRAQAADVARGIVTWARTVPADARTTPEVVEAIQLATDLAGLAPAEAGQALRRDLKELRVAVFVIRTVREQMRYDVTRLVVEAGKPFEIVFENADFMPHNLVMVKPGTREKVGAAAALMTPDQRDGQGRPYVPRGDDAWAGSRLIDGGQQQVLKLKAPDAEGVHEFVCTFPGHWMSMWGQLVVTKDVDAYLAAHPEAPWILPTASPEGP